TARLGRDRIANALFARMGADALQAEDFYLLGLGLSQAGRKEEARRMWIKALALEPARLETLEQLVKSSTEQNRLVEAARYAETLSKQPGWEFRGELNWGALLAEVGDPASSATVLGRALARSEAHALDQSALGRYRNLLARKLLET